MKTFVAMIGAVLIGVAMKADLLLGVANKNALATVPEPFTISAVAFVVCFVAGFSESLVPRFLNTFETSNDLSGRRAAMKSPSKRALPGDGQSHLRSAERSRGHRMATRKMSYGGKDYVVVAEPHNGKFITRIVPQGGKGRYIRDPDTQVAHAITGETTTQKGKPVEFDTEKGALDAGEDNSKKGMV